MSAVRRLDAHAESGAVPIELALGVALLLLPVAFIVLTLPTWVERQSMARLAAQEGARAAVLSPDPAVAVDRAHRVAAEVAANHGAALDSVEVSGKLTRGGVVTVRVTVAMPAPLLDDGLAWQWSTTHAESVDAYRSFE